MIHDVGRSLSLGIMTKWLSLFGSCLIIVYTWIQQPASCSVKHVPWFNVKRHICLILIYLRNQQTSLEYTYLLNLLFNLHFYIGLRVWHTCRVLIDNWKVKLCLPLMVHEKNIHRRMLQHISVITVINKTICIYCISANNLNYKYCKKSDNTYLKIIWKYPVTR